jgi:branched-chain amino acid transport system permease protein
VKNHCLSNKIEEGAMGISRYARHPMFIILATFLVVPVIVMPLGGMSLAIEVMIWAIFAMGFNILLGVTGLPSFGHGIFFGAGAYICGLIQQHIVPSTWIPLLGSLLFCAALAAVLGIFLARKRGIYFALLTIAFTQMFFFVAFQWDSVTGGENGLMGIERYPLSIFGLFTISIKGILAYYYFVFCILGASLILLWKLVHSPLGSVLYAIRQNEVRAKYLGYNTVMYKLIALLISGVFGGLAGALYAMLTHGAFADPIHWTRSGDVVMMVLVGGGLSNFFGPVLGAGIFIALRDIFSTITEHWYLFYGLLIVFIILFLPEGILGYLKSGQTGTHATGPGPETAPSGSRRVKQ